MTKKTSKDKLMRLMGKYRLSCPMVARLIGVKPQTVRSWRSGRSPVPEYALTIIDLTYGR
jgi:DNA-binding transcriptional regulator YiaG